MPNSSHRNAASDSCCRCWPWSSPAAAIQNGHNGKLLPHRPSCWHWPMQKQHQFAITIVQFLLVLPLLFAALASSEPPSSPPASPSIVVPILPTHNDLLALPPSSKNDASLEQQQQPSALPALPDPNFSPTNGFQALTSWSGWPQLPTLGGGGAQPWPNPLLFRLPSLFPNNAIVPLAAENGLFSMVQKEEKKPVAATRQQSADAVVHVQPEENSLNNETTGIEEQQQKRFVGIRVRFNPPIFEEIARLFYSVFNHEAQQIQIRPQKQCFAEGCFRLHTFRITGFQRPRALTLKPLVPNLLLLNILSFDVDIESLLNGNVQLLLTTVPVTGNFQASTRQLSITALFDLQKDQNKVPYLRMASCELRSGSVSTKVSNLGLLTDSINLKYKTEMLEKARELITSTICDTISDTIRERVNQVLRRLPRAINVATILSALSRTFIAAKSCAENPVVQVGPFNSGGRPSSPALSPSQSAPLAFQLDSPMRFYSNHYTLAYGGREGNWQQQQQRFRGDGGGEAIRPSIGGWRNRENFWRGKRKRRGLEVISPNGSSISGIVGNNNVKNDGNDNAGDQQQQQRVMGRVEEITVAINQKVEKKDEEKNVLPTTITTATATLQTTTIKEKEEERETMAKEIRLKEAANKRIVHPSSSSDTSNCSNAGSELLNFLDMNSLAKVFIELDFLDSSAGQDFFAVGLSGDVFLRMPHQVSFVGGGVREVLATSTVMTTSSSSTTSTATMVEHQHPAGPNSSAAGNSTNKLLLFSNSGIIGSSSRSSNSAEEEDNSLLLNDDDNDDKQEGNNNGNGEKHREEEQDQEQQQQQHGNDGKSDDDNFPPMLRFPSQNLFRKTLEIISSDLTANLVLLQAHRAKLLKVRIGPNSSAFGLLLKTSCGPDEVCLGDSVPEAAEKYPEEQLELEVEPVQPPRIRFSKDLASFSLIGAGTFFLARNKQAIARIPFTATVELHIRTIVPKRRSTTMPTTTMPPSTATTKTTANNNSTGIPLIRDGGGNTTTTTVGMTTISTTTTSRSDHGVQVPNKLEVSLSIPKLEILEDVDFFELPASMLDGFRDAIRGAIINNAAKALAQG